MLKSSFGFMAGVAAASLAYLIFADRWRDEPRAVVMRPNVEETASPTEDSAVARSAVGQAASPSDVASDSVGDLRARETQLRQVIEDLRQELRDVEIARRMAEAGPVIYPMTLPHEFGWVFEDPTRKLFHELVQREDRDDEWAEVKEAQLEDFLYERSEAVTHFGPPTITCRTTRCEVTFIKYQADQLSILAATELRTAFRRELGAEFGRVPGALIAEERLENAVFTVFWSLPRAGTSTVTGP